MPKRKPLKLNAETTKRQRLHALNKGRVVKAICQAIRKPAPKG